MFFTVTDSKYGICLSSKHKREFASIAAILKNRESSDLCYHDGLTEAS